MFPTADDVKFYTDDTYSTEIANTGATDVAEGTAVADAGIVEPVAGTDFDLVNADGDYFSEFKYVDATGTEQKYADLTTIDAAAAVDGGSEIKVYPAYIPGTDLTFHGNYPDSTDTTKTVTVSPASDATIPKTSEPTVGTSGTDFTIPTGYVFGGWYDNSACTGDAIVFDDTDDESDNPTLVSNLAGTDIYAKWVDAIKVEFVKVKDSADAGNVVETYYIDPNAADKTVSAPATNPTRDGYVFDKWCYDVDGTATDFVAKGTAGATEFSANTTVYATWKKSVKVIYYDTDKTTELKNETIVTGDNFTPPTVNDDTTNNKYFDGWKKVDDDTAFDVSQPLSADITSDELELYVNMKDAYTVKFYKEAEKTNLLDTKYSNSVTPAALGDANMPSEPTETGKKFSGWKVVGTDATFDETTVVNGDMEVYAAWDSLWKIEFYEDGDDTVAAHTKYVDPDVKKLDEVPADPTARTGYRFDGWFIENTTTKVDTTTEFSGDTKVFGKWTQLFTVEFYDTLTDATTDGSTPLASEVVDSGNKVTASTVPATTDNDTDKKYFKGWKTTDGTDFDPANDTVTADLKLYRDWGDYYKVEFYTEDTLTSDKLHDTLYVNPNVATTVSALPTNPTKTGYAFNEWRVYADGAVTTAKFDTSTTVSGNMTVVADWIQKVKISFYPNDGTEAGGLGTVQEVYVTPNVAFDGTVPTVSRTGYTLKEWNTASNGSGTGYTNVATATFAADTTLYAIWTANGSDTATLTFDANLDGVTPNPSSVTVNVNDKVYSSNIPVVAKDNYRFDGWYESPSISDTNAIDFSAGYTVTENKTVYAHWTYTGVDKVTVTFMNDSAEYAKVDVAPNTTLGNMMPTNPTKTGFAFKEWNTATDGEGTKFDKDTNVGTTAVTVYSQWIEDITVTYDANQGSNPPAPVTKPAGDKYEDPDTTSMTRTDYYFTVWNTKPNGSGTTVAADGTLTYADVAALDGNTGSSITLYAIWDAGPDPYNPDPDDPTIKGIQVIFNTNATGTGVVDANPNTTSVDDGDAIGEAQMPNIPVRPDHQFLGWNTQENGGGLDLTGTSVISTVSDYGNYMMGSLSGVYEWDLNVYAQWKYTGADAVIVNFINDGSQYATITVAPNTTLDQYMPDDPEKTGFAFKEWNTAEDGTGTKFESTTNVGAGPATVTVYAQWIEDITVNYNANGGTDGPASVTKPAANAYEDPDVTNMAKDGYTFVGWNTEQNGSCTYVEADGTLTYADVAEMFTPAGGTAPTEVTVYAQWAWTPDDDDTIDDIIDDTPVDPDVNGVRVTFDSNSAGATTTVKDANPKYKYPQLGDAIGTDNMPNDPEREKYVFQGWNTAQDGSGVAFTGTTTVDSATLGDALVEIKENDLGTGKYEVTLYAQWELSTEVLPAEAVTVTFNKNLDGSGAAGDLIKTVTLYKGDALGYDVAAPTNGTYEFNGWYAGDNTSGKVVFTANKFTATTPITESIDYYAQWQMYLLVQVQPKVVDGAEVDYTYTGVEIKPQYKVFQITYPNGNQQPYEIVDDTTPIYTGDFTDSQFKVEYKKDGSVATLKDAGTYTINASFADGSALQAAGAQIAVTDAPTIEIKPAGLTFKVNPDDQKQKAGQVTLPTPASVEGIQNSEAADTIYGNAYYAWTDSDNDNNIADAELATTTTAEDVGKYVWKIELKSTNYIIEEVESSVDGKDVMVYGVTADYPTYTDSKEGQNLVLDVVPNDPSIKTVTVKSVDNVDEDGNAVDPAVEENLTLKKNDYTTDETFDNAEEPTVTDYYIRVTDKDADNVTFTLELTNPETTTLTVTGGTAVKNADGTYTVTAPLTNKGATANVVEIKTTAGDAADAPTLTYTFNIQQLVEAKITLNYGNSPYGEIMKAANIADADKQAAKDAFDQNNSFSNSYLPTATSAMYLNGTDRIVYRPEVWTAAGEANMDKDDTAIFIYNGQTFRDPGFVATDSLGQTVSDADITREIKVNRMLSDGTAGTTNVTDFDAANAADTGSLLTYAGVDNDYLFTDITSDSPSVKMIRPGVYDMKYTFIDSATGTTVEKIRKVIVLFKTGDTDLSTDISPINLNAIKVAVATGKNDITGAPSITNSLYLHRMMDTDNSGDVSPIDLNKIKVTVATGAPIQDYYIPLEDN